MPPLSRYDAPAVFFRPRDSGDGDPDFADFYGPRCVSALPPVHQPSAVHPRLLAGAEALAAPSAAACKGQHEPRPSALAGTRAACCADSSEPPADRGRCLARPCAAIRARGGRGRAEELAVRRWRAGWRGRGSWRVLRALLRRSPDRGLETGQAAAGGCQVLADVLALAAG